MYFRFSSQRRCSAATPSLRGRIHNSKGIANEILPLSTSLSRRHVEKEPLESLFCSSLIGTRNTSNVLSQMSWEEAWAQRSALGVLACLSPYACTSSSFLASVLPDNLEDSVVEVQDMGVALVAAVVEPIYWPPWVRRRVSESNRQRIMDRDSRCLFGSSHEDWSGWTKRSRQVRSGCKVECERQRSNDHTLTSCEAARTSRKKGETRTGFHARPLLLPFSSSFRKRQLRHVAFSLLKSLSDVTQSKLLTYSESTPQSFPHLPVSSLYASTLPLWLSLCALCVAENDEDAVALACLTANVFPEAAGCALCAYCSIEAAAENKDGVRDNENRESDGNGSLWPSTDVGCDLPMGNTTKTAGSSMRVEEHWLYLWKRVKKELEERRAKDRGAIKPFTAWEEDVFDPVEVWSWFLSWEVHCHLAINATHPCGDVANTITRGTCSLLGTSCGKVNLNEMARVLTGHMRCFQRNEGVADGQEGAEKIAEALAPSAASFPFYTPGLVTDSPTSASSFAPRSGMVPLMSKVLREMPVFAQLEWVTAFPSSSVLCHYGGPDNIVLLCYSEVCDALLASAVASAKVLHSMEDGETGRCQDRDRPFLRTASPHKKGHWQGGSQAVFSVPTHPTTSTAVVQTRLLQHILFRAANLLISTKSTSFFTPKEEDAETPFLYTSLKMTDDRVCTTPRLMKEGAYTTYIRLVEEMTALVAVHNPHALAASLVPLHDKQASSLQAVMEAKRCSVRASRTAELLGNILTMLRWLCTGDVVWSSHSYPQEKQNDSHIPLFWRREQKERVGRAVKEAVRLVTALLSLCANKEGSLPSRRSIPAWRLKLAAASAARSHKYELLLSELPHEHLASIFSLLLHYGFMEEVVTLSYCVVNHNQLNLSAYPASLIGSMWLAVTSSSTHQDSTFENNSVSTSVKSKELSGKTTKERVAGCLLQFYRQRILVFGDNAADHGDEPNDSKEGIPQDIKKDAERGLSSFAFPCSSSTHKIRDAHPDATGVIFSPSTGLRGDMLSSTGKADAKRELISLAGSSSSFFCSSISSKVIWRAKGVQN